MYTEFKHLIKILHFIVVGFKYSKSFAYYAQNTKRKIYNCFRLNCLLCYVSNLAWIVLGFKVRLFCDRDKKIDKLFV